MHSKDSQFNLICDECEELTFAKEMHCNECERFTLHYNSRTYVMECLHCGTEEWDR